MKYSVDLVSNQSLLCFCVHLSVNQQWQCYAWCRTSRAL